MGGRSNNTNKLSPQEHRYERIIIWVSSNNTNKLSPQERIGAIDRWTRCSNNTNKLSPQEHGLDLVTGIVGSNNTNKLSPQELESKARAHQYVQIIQINLVLKNEKS